MLSLLAMLKNAAYGFISLSDYFISEYRDVEFFEHVFPLKKKVTSVVVDVVNLPASSSHVRDIVIELRRSKRCRIETSFGLDFVTTFLVETFENLDVDVITEELVSIFLIEEDPKTYQEAIRSIDATFWKEAIKSEIDSPESNKIWELTDLHKDCRPISSKWIFKKKLRSDGSINKYKAKLIIRGYDQKKGIDYFDTYSPVTRIATIRTLITLAALFNLVVHQMDVKTTFLNGDLEKETYMTQPEGCEAPGQENKVCRLRKSLYSLK